MEIDLNQQSKKEQSGTAYNLGDFKILVVEDSPFIANLLGSCLMEIGVGSVIKAGNVRDAKDKILSNNAMTSGQNIDMIILDWLMPDGTGGDVLKWIRGHKNASIKFVPVVICSAYTSTELVYESRDLGANEVMVKPVSAEKITQRMLHIIDHPRPYVQAPDFVGPDRRRRTLPFDGEDRRKNKPEVISES